MKKITLLTILTLALCAGKLNAQLTGTVTVPGTYATLAAAITDLNTLGVGPGGVIINVTAAQAAPAGGYQITASGTSANPITIVGNNNVVTASNAHTVGALNDAVFKLLGADYVSIVSFVMTENPANTTATPTGSNTMTEWGVALLYGSTTNGAQFNSIVANTISLNRTYANTWGVYSNVRHSATSISTTADITSPTGSNSNNKVYGNSISNVNMGIAFIGSSAFANADAGNDIGGSSALTGNTITNWGGAAAASGYISNTGTSYCIFANHQTSLNLSYNTVTSANVTPTVTFRGIVQDFTAGSWGIAINNTISNNQVTMTSAQTGGTFRGIDAVNAGSIGTTSVLNNTVSNCQITGASSSSALVGINCSGVVATLVVTGNQVYGNSSTAISGGFTGISSSSAVTNSTTISNNQIGTASADAITFSAAQSGNVTGILNSGGAVGATINIQSNNIQRIVHSVTGSSGHAYINNTAANPSTNITGNTFTDLTVNTTGTVTFISNNVTHAANTTHNVSNNAIVTQFTKSGGGGAVFFYNSSSSSPNTVSEINDGNNFSNVSVTGGTTINGWRCTDGASTAPFGPSKTVTNNTFSNITGGTNAIIVLQVDNSNANAAANNVSGNIISNVTGANSITGILSGQGAQHFFNNTISGLNGSIGAVISGILLTNGSTQNIYNNKIYDLECGGAGGLVAGIRTTTSGTLINIYNNLIGNLRTPAADVANAVSGISIGAGTNVNIYYNTIHLNATSTGTNFGTSGITVGTQTVDMRNNLVVNLSVANGSGLTVAYRRTTTSLLDYATTSNNNSFYAGTPGPANVIFYDGTNSDQTIVAYRARVTPADANSITTNPTFASITGSSPQFLHIAAATATGLESGGTAIPSVTTADYDNDTRPGPIPSVNGGGTAPDIGADEFDGVPGCLGAPSTVIPNSSPASVCGSGTFTLTSGTAPTGQGISYQWQQSSTSGGPYTDIPGATSTTYTTSSLSTTMYYVFVVTCANSGLTSMSSELVATVYAIPTVGATVTQTVVCDGESVTFNGSGADTYAWTGGVTDNVPFTPTVTDTYTVTGTDVNGCTNTATVSVTVNALPVVTASVSASSVCDGETVTFNGGGATFYTWTGGVTDNLPFTPSLSNTYTVTGTDANGCTNTATASVTVNALPVVTASVTASAVCDGDQVTFNGGGATSYTWTGGVTDNVPFTPTLSNTYTVTGTDANGCTNTATASVTVNALPTVTASVTASAVCDGGQVTFNGGGATAYTWTGGVTDNVPFTPTVTDTYTVTGTDANGCTNTATTSVTVNPLPVVTLSLPMDTICQSVGTVTLSGESPTGGTWSGPGVSGNTLDPMTSGVGTFGIDYTYTDANGCSAMTTDSVVVDICLDVTAVTATNSAFVYPNPNDGAFTIQLPATPTAPVQVEIMNELGQVVTAFTMTTSRADADITGFEGGVYFVRVINGTEVSVYRVVKQ